jgi:seryl-tRNA synthetase
MLDIKFVRKNTTFVQEALEKRGSALRVQGFLDLDAKRRALILETETLKAERNSASAEIAKAKRAGEDASGLIARMSEVAERIKALDVSLREVDAQTQEWLMGTPNIPHESTPVGADENDNPVVRVWGEPPSFDFEPREHYEIAGALGGLDFERAAKLTGARFSVLYGWAAKLDRALASFMLDVQTQEHGYTEVLPPYIVNSQSLFGTGNLPKFAEDLFKLENWDYYLIPTAEVPLTNLHRDEILEEDDLPLSYCALTPCFRSEAGSYGKDVKGLIRQHQFHKVELVHFCRPEDSFDVLERLTANAESILQRLGLPYRVVSLCTGDLGFSSCKTYDLEVWLPGQGKYREISSCSNMLDFQARRMGARYRPKGSKKSALVHTLNGSGLAVGRALVAVLENGQRKDGSVVLPEALRPYMGGVAVLEP